MKWALQSKENEQAIIKKIAKDIRFELMDQAFFNAEVKTCTFLQDNTYVKAADKLIQKIPNKFGRQRKFRSRVPLELVFAVGHDTTIQAYNLRTNSWCSPKCCAFPAKFKESNFYGIAAVDGKLVAMEGNFLQ